MIGSSIRLEIKLKENTSLYSFSGKGATSVWSRVTKDLFPSSCQKEVQGKNTPAEQKLKLPLNNSGHNGLLQDSYGMKTTYKVKRQHLVNITCISRQTITERTLNAKGFMAQRI